MKFHDRLTIVIFFQWLTGKICNFFNDPFTRFGIFFFLRNIDEIHNFFLQPSDEIWAFLIQPINEAPVFFFSLRQKWYLITFFFFQWLTDKICNFFFCDFFPTTYWQNLWFLLCEQLTWLLSASNWHNLHFFPHGLLPKFTFFKNDKWTCFWEMLLVCFKICSKFFG